MSSFTYWQKRAEQLLLANERATEKYVNELNRVYKLASESIEVEINKIFKTYKKDFTATEARAWLSEKISPIEYKELLDGYALVTDKSLKKQMLMRLNAPAYRYRMDRLEYIKQEISWLSIRAAEAEINIHTNCYKNTVKNSYYHSLYEIQRGTELGFTVPQMPSSTIEKLLNAKWYGKNFSQSVWDNTALVAEKSAEILKAGVLAGESTKKMAKALLEKTYTANMNNAVRLIRTEVNYFTNQGAYEAYKEAEIEKYEFLSTLDLRTSAMCREQDGKIYFMDNAQVGVNYPPLHPYCRSTVVPIIDIEGLERLSERSARDSITGKSIKLQENINYKQWYDKYVAVNPKAVIKENQIKNLNSDKKQYEKYKGILGENAPKTFANFQDLKYNDRDKYEDLKGFYRYKNENPNSDKIYYEIDKALIQLRRNKSIRAKGQAVFPNQNITINKANDHTKIRFAERNLTLQEAIEFKNNAVIALKQRKGTQYQYFSSKGFVVANLEGEIQSIGWLDEAGELIVEEVLKYV